MLWPGEVLQCISLFNEGVADDFVIELQLLPDQLVD